MDEASMMRKLGKLKLTKEKKGKVVEIEDEEINECEKWIENTVVCKIFSERNVIPDIFKTVMPKIWGAEDEVKIDQAGKNLFLCQFRKKKDKNQVLKEGPWIFDKALLLFEELRGSSKILSLEFKYASFWVHFHELPMVGFTRKTAIDLGNSVGMFEKADLEDERSKGGKLLRVRIRIDIQKPLRRATKVKQGTMAKEEWSPITYEKLPDFYYGCGRIGHLIKDCEEKEEEDKGSE